MSRASDAALDLFRELSRVYRPSFEEDAMRAFVASVVQRARPRWPEGALRLTKDAAGNLLICVPGTGRFADAQPVALQGHMDMVMEHVDNDIGGDPRRFFKDGVVTELVRDNGTTWMRSKGATSTLGADNGVFDAVALLYVTDPTLEHPPLELVFTATEERGLIGARKLELPLTARVLLNLDSEIEGTVTRGCQGSQRRVLEGHAATEPIPSSSAVIGWRIAGLSGGHSGLEIQRDLANAIIVMATIIESSEARLVAATAGGDGALNKIANSCIAVLAVPSDSADSMKHDLTAKANALIGRCTDDVAATITFTAEYAQRCFTRDATRLLARAIAKADNGVIERDTAMPNAVRTSSNLGLLEANANNGHLRLGFMTRSFDGEALETCANRIQETLSTAFADTPKRSGEHSPAWLVPESDSLVQLALAEPKLFREAVVTPAGIETGPIVERYPGMRAISFGPNIEGAHTVGERLDVDSFHRFVETTQAMLARIALAG